jgi:hypothetical protein
VRERASHAQRIDKIRDETDCAELGAGHFIENDRARVANRLLERPGELGFEVRDVQDRLAP